MPTIEELLAQRYSLGADILDDVSEIDVRPAKLSPELQRKRDLGLLGVLAGGSRAPAKVGAALYEDVGKEASAAQKAEAQSRLKLATMMQQLQRDAETRAARQDMWEQNAELRRELAGMGQANAADRKAAANENRNWRLEDQMRAQLDRSLGNTLEELSAIGKIKQLAPALTGRVPTAVEQQSMVILLNKFLDPGSVVREGEFNRVIEAQGLNNRASNLLARITEGKPLGPQMISDIITIADLYERAALAKGQRVGGEYTRIATERGLDPTAVVIDERFRPVAGASKPPPGAVRVKGSQAAPPSAAPVTPSTVGGPPPGSVREKR